MQIRQEEMQNFRLKKIIQIHKIHYDVSRIVGGFEAAHHEWPWQVDPIVLFESIINNW